MKYIKILLVLFFTLGAIKFLSAHGFDDSRWLDNGSGYKQFECLDHSAVVNLTAACNGYLGLADAAPAVALSVGTSGAAMKVNASTKRTALGGSTAASTLAVKANLGDATYVFHASSTSEILSATAGGLIKATGSIHVSTAAGSVPYLNFAGQFAALPASGVLEGTIAYQSSDHKLYVSTCAVDSATDDWVALH